MDSLMNMVTVWLIVCFLCTTLADEHDCVNRCYPADEDCFPSTSDWNQFAATLDGGIITKGNSGYNAAIVMYETWLTRNPNVIVYPESVEDVQKSILFAKEHNLHVTVRSSGHDFIGRSTADGSIQINMKNMKKISVNLSSTRHTDGEIIMETGCPWAEAYKETDKYDRVVLGGSAHTVTPGGYTQGGGHSPLSRSLGLAVDQVLEMKVVVVDGRIIDCTENGMTVTHINGSVTTSTDTDLFWALRGGGGGTYGIVVTYTFKLHRQPSQMVVGTVSYGLSLNGDITQGDAVLSKYAEWVKDLPTEWGGYVLLGNTKIPIPFGDTTLTMIGTFTLFMNHFGPWDSPTVSAFREWESFLPLSQGGSFKLYNKTSFWDYSQNVTDAPSARSYITSVFVQPGGFTDDLKSFLLRKLTSDYDDPTSETYGLGIGGTGIHIGGMVGNYSLDSAPIHPGFRSALLSLTLGIGMLDPCYDSRYIEKGKQLGRELRGFGSGVYVNEPEMNLENWKSEFWGTHYSRLLAIKKKWDPDTFLTCRYCVGSDEAPICKWNENVITTATCGVMSNTYVMHALLLLTNMLAFLIIL